MRWPQAPALTIVAVVCSSVAAVATGNAALAIVTAGALCLWLCAGMRVDLTGAGFRPLRVRDLLELSASDQLDHYDREQAIARAKAG